MVSYTSSLLENVEIIHIDLNDYVLPIYGVDYEKENAIPIAVKRLDELLNTADGFLISLAEHNGSYAAVFKNTLDWLSRANMKIWIGKWAAVVVMLLAIAWSTQGGRFNSIFEAINKIAAALAPPIATVFLLGVFSKRGTKEASLITLIAGFLMGIMAFRADFIPALSGNPSIITDIWGIPFMMQAWWLFCICCVIYVVVSYSTEKPTEDQLKYTWEKPWLFLTEKKFQGISDVRLYAGLLLLTIGILYVIFCVVSYQIMSQASY